MHALRTQAPALALALALGGALAVGGPAACDGCAGAPAGGDDAGGGVEGEGEGQPSDAGPGDAGARVDAGNAVADAGPQPDAGNGFDLGSLLDGGIDGLQCLPPSLPSLSISGAIDALGLRFYQGFPENGVKCGDVTCVNDTPCCLLCGAAACAGEGDAGPVCPFFTATYNCDGNEDCNGNDVCCFTLGGTVCRAESDCNFDVGAAIGRFLGDGGLAFPDAGFFDGGFIDGGFEEVPVDGGEVDGGVVDGGFVTVGIDGGPGPQVDAGSFLDGLQQTLNAGVPVCHSSLFDCPILQGEACCTSDRLTAVDVGFCLPALLCAGSLLP